MEETHPPEQSNPNHEKLMRHLEPQWVNHELVEKADKLLLFRLPKDNHLGTIEALRLLPYPILTIRRSLPGEPWGQTWPGDYAISVEDTLYCMEHRLKGVLKPLLEFADQSISQRIHGDIRGFINYATAGGQLVLDQKGKNAITSNEAIHQDLTSMGYTSVYIPDLPYREIYRDRPEYLFLPQSDHVDPLMTLFTDKERRTHLRIDEVVNPFFQETSPIFPKKWDKQLVDHHSVRMGALNLQYLGSHVLAPPQQILGALDKELRDSGFTPIYLPYEVTSEDGGPKCRSLIIPLHPPEPIKSERTKST